MFDYIYGKICDYIYGTTDEVIKKYSDDEVIDKFEVLSISDKFDIDNVESENVLYHYFISDSTKAYIKNMLSPILYKILITLLQKSQYKLAKMLLSYYFPHYQIVAILLKLL